MSMITISPNGIIPEFVFCLLSRIHNIHQQLFDIMDIPMNVVGHYRI
jgi:hypothetical protein